MKKEAYLKGWLLGALVLEVFASYQPYTCILYKPGSPAYDVGRYLFQDVSFGLCLLPVIAGLRRGTSAEQVAACLLALLPLTYIFCKVAADLPNCLQLLSD